MRLPANCPFQNMRDPIFGGVSASGNQRLPANCPFQNMRDPIFGGVSGGVRQVLQYDWLIF